MSFQIREVNGNIFSASSEYSLAHCVGADLRMGKGIAAEFNKRFGQKEVLKSQNVGTGGVAVLPDGPRFIYYLLTKLLSYHSATYDALFKSLDSMRTHMDSIVEIRSVLGEVKVGVFDTIYRVKLNNGVTKLAIPRLGCGLDRLSWPRVKARIKEIFANDTVEIVVYNHVQNKN